MQLSWAAPYDGNSPIKKFLIEYKRAKGNWEKDIDRYFISCSNILKSIFSVQVYNTFYFAESLYLETRLKPEYIAYDQLLPTTSGLSLRTNWELLSRLKLSPLSLLKKHPLVPHKIAKSMPLTSIHSASPGSLPHLRTGTANFRGKILSNNYRLFSISKKQKVTDVLIFQILCWLQTSVQQQVFRV